MRFKFLKIKRFSGGVVGEPGFPTNVILLGQLIQRIQENQLLFRQFLKYHMFVKF